MMIKNAYVISINYFPALMKSARSEIIKINIYNNVL